MKIELTNEDLENLCQALAMADNTCLKLTIKYKSEEDFQNAYKYLEASVKLQGLIRYIEETQRMETSMCL